MQPICDGLTESLLRQIDRTFGPRDLLYGAEQLSDFDVAAAQISISPCEAYRLSSRRMLGVDYGREESYAVVLGNLPDLNGNVLCVLHAETMQAFEPDGYRDIDRVRELAEEFRVDSIIDDPNGIGWDRHRLLTKILPERPVIGAYFDTSTYAQRRDAESKPSFSEGKVVMNKVMALASLLKAIRGGRILILEELSSREQLERHLTSMSVKTGAAGPRSVHQPVVKYHHDDDHLLCCLMYARVGFWRKS